MATNALPSERSDQKCLNSDSVSIVPPDFVETRKSAWSRSMAVSTLRTAPASVESSTCRLGQPACSPKERRMTSGASDEPPMPSSTTSLTPSSRTPSAKACRSSSSSRICSATVSHPRRLATSGWPAGPHSVSSLRQMRRATSSCGGLLDALGHARLDVLVGQRGVDRRRALGDDRLALGADALEQLLHRLDELVDALAQQLVGDVDHVDAGVGQRLQDGRRVLAGGGAADLGVVAGGQQRGHRHRVDGVRPDELLDVHHVAVGRVLDAGRGPQRALHGGAGVAQGGEALAEEDLLVALVGGARVGDAGLAEQVVVAGALQALVDLGVHARDEERRDRVDVDRLALLEAALEAADVGLGHLRVLLDAEEQGDVDVAPLVDHLLDRGRALLGARDLDHQVGAIDALPVLARLLHRAVGVEGEVGIDLEGHEAVLAAALVVDDAQHVAGVLDVADRELLVDPAVVQALAREPRRAARRSRRSRGSPALKIVGLEVTPRSESSSTSRCSSPVLMSARLIWSSQMLVPAAVRAARRSLTCCVAMGVSSLS